MMKITCICVMALIALTVADRNETSCCTPERFVSITKVPGKAICYALGRNDTTPASLNCENGFVRFLYKHIFFYENGKIEIIQNSGESRHELYNPLYCINNMHNSQTNETYKFGFFCNDAPRDKINEYAMIVSVVFLTLSLVIYSVLSELRDLQGKSFINLCGSLALGLCLFVVLKLIGSDFVDTNLCAARGFFAYFFLIASFFWTTAISIQLLLSIRSPSSVVGRGWKNFAWYALFAWGCPTIITICMAIVNFIPGDHVKPIGYESCWFEQRHDIQRWYWLFGVLGTLISVNVLIFAYVTFYFCRNSFASRQITTYRYRFYMALKLFIVMGIYWILEIITSSTVSDHVFWKILEIITSLQGLWIFLAWVVFRKRVIRAMHKRGWLPCISGIVENHLANDDEADADIVEHTSVPMNEH